MNCKQIQNLLTYYYDKELTDSENKIVEEHISQCRSCSEELTMIKKIEESARKVFVGKEPPEEYWNSYLVRLHWKMHKKEKKNILFDIWKMLWSTSLPVKVGSAVAGIILVIYLVFNHTNKIFYKQEATKINESVEKIGSKSMEEIGINDIKAGTPIAEVHDTETSKTEVTPKDKEPTETITPQKDIESSTSNNLMGTSVKPPTLTVEDNKVAKQSTGKGTSQPSTTTTKPTSTQDSQIRTDSSQDKIKETAEATVVSTPKTSKEDEKDDKTEKTTVSEKTKGTDRTSTTGAGSEVETVAKAESTPTNGKKSQSRLRSSPTNEEDTIYYSKSKLSDTSKTTMRTATGGTSYLPDEFAGEIIVKGEEDRMYRNARRLQTEGKIGLAITQYQEQLAMFPKGNFADSAQFEYNVCQYQTKSKITLDDLRIQEKNWENFLSQYPESKLTISAMLNLADVEYRIFDITKDKKDGEKAFNTYKKCQKVFTDRDKIMPLINKRVEELEEKIK